MTKQKKTDRVDAAEVTVTKAALFRQFVDVIVAVPDWTDSCACLPLLPSRASEKCDYENLKSLRDKQARYLQLLTTLKGSNFDAATDSDLTTAKHALLREAKKLSLLDCRLEIYTTVLQQVPQVAFNEHRLATDHTSKNEPNVIRAILTFKQALILVNAISLKHIAENNKLIVDIAKHLPWNYTNKCYLMLDVFRSGTMQVEKRRFSTKYVQIKYFEASWPGALVAHRIQPLPGSMHAHTRKTRHRSGHETQQHVHDDVRQRSQDYAVMLRNLMVMIQDYILLNGTPQQKGDNKICIWLEDMMW